MNAPFRAFSTASEAPLLVTASDLVRQFGVWQDRAARAPVYVLHRGRPKLVLASVDLMDALCAPHRPAADDLTAGSLMAALGPGVILLDADGRLAGCSRGAAAALGPAALAGATLAQLWPDPHGFLTRAIGRAFTAGASDVLDVAAPGRPGQQWSVTVEPLGAQVLLTWRDNTDEERARAASAERRAHDQGAAILGLTATVRINVRGYVEAPGGALAALSGVEVEALAAARFVSLLEVGSRVAAAEAIEAAIATGAAVRADALLLVNRAAPRRVAIGYAPRHGRSAVEGVLATIVADAASS